MGVIEIQRHFHTSFHKSFKIWASDLAGPVSVSVMVRFIYNSCIQDIPSSRARMAFGLSVRASKDNARTKAKVTDRAEKQ